MKGLRARWYRGHDCTIVPRLDAAETSSTNKITKDPMMGGRSNRVLVGGMTMSNTDADWNQQVLEFWFNELSKKDWFIASQSVDTVISDKFSTTHAQVSALSELPLDADEYKALAIVIVLDQFSRNLYRGSKKAFAFDAPALNIAKQALTREYDLTLSDDEKQFLYMPFMHSENMEDQRTSVALFTKLGRPEHAVEHMNIFAQFDRFPHRNDILGRQSTAQEIEFLKSAKRFGQ